jgi:hypothetical protein
VAKYETLLELIEKEVFVALETKCLELDDRSSQYELLEPLPVTVLPRCGRLEQHVTVPHLASARNF